MLTGAAATSEGSFTGRMVGTPVRAGRGLGHDLGSDVVEFDVAALRDLVRYRNEALDTRRWMLSADLCVVRPASQLAQQEHRMFA